MCWGPVGACGQKALERGLCIGAERAKGRGSEPGEFLGHRSGRTLLVDHVKDSSLYHTNNGKPLNDFNWWWWSWK